MAPVTTILGGRRAAADELLGNFHSQIGADKGKPLTGGLSVPRR
jgi:hypothetical protein